MRLRPAVIVLVSLLASGPMPRAATAAEMPDGDVPAARNTVQSLETRLKNGLQARLPRENRFVADVVDHVHAGRLPQKLVDSTYLWAVQRKPRYPFAAFEKALRIHAAKLGVTF